MKADVLMAITGERSVGVPLEERREASDVTLLMERQRDVTARGRESQSSRSPEWTHAECAQANVGVERRFWLAQMYVYRLDNSVQLELLRELIKWALRQRIIENWPNTYRTQEGDERQFLMELLHMALVEVREPWRFACGAGSKEQNPRRLQMRCSQHVWRRHLSPIYEAIMSEFLAWVSIGVAQANRKLSEDS